MRILAFCLSFILSLGAMAQNFPLVPVQALQTHPGQNLNNCDDSPNPLYFNDTVRVRVIVIANGAISTSSLNRWFWGRDVNATPNTPFANINIRYNVNIPTTPNDIRDLEIGDTVEVTGILEEFAAPANFFHETQLVPLTNGVRIIGEDVGPAPAPRLTNVQELNGILNANNQPTNNLVTGEPIEGNYIEIRDVEVERLDAGVADRFRFMVKDANNNRIWIFDKFNTIRPANPSFTRPNIGDRFNVIRGVVEHERNGCPNSGTNNRGYMINPFRLADLEVGAAAPSITNISRNPITPTGSQGVTVSANITDDGTVTSATLFFAVGATNNQYAQVNMTASGSTYSGTIPAQPNGSVVKYYISAVDNQGNRTTSPNVPNNINPLFYWVNDAGTTIRDIQRTPFTTSLNSFGGNSGYVGLDVTLEGIVTATQESNNLGSVYIQEPGASSWAGIWLAAATSLNPVRVGNRIRVTGTVQENFNMTRLNAISNVVVVSPTGETINPITLPPALFSTPTNPECEQYEGMLVRIAGLNAGERLFVVDTNANASGTANFGDYRVNTDQFDPVNGTAILAGRQNNNTFSSLAVSYVNSARWATQDGNITVPVNVVQLGDAFTSITGILYYGFGQYKLLPRNNNDFQLSTFINNQISGGIKIFPNPTAGKLTIENATTMSGSSFTLVDLTGRKLQRQQLTPGINQVDLGKTSPGVYTLMIYNENGGMVKLERISVQ